MATSTVAPLLTADHAMDIVRRAVSCVVSPRHPNSVSTHYAPFQTFQEHASAYDHTLRLVAIEVLLVGAVPPAVLDVAFGAFFFV